MEKSKSSPLPIIEFDEFELTECDIELARREVEILVNKWKIAVNDPNEHIRERAQRFLSQAEKEKQTLAARPREVLARVRTFYDRTVELGNLGVDKAQLAEQLGDEFPDFKSYSLLLRMNPWGYRFVGIVASAVAEPRPIRELQGK